MKIFQIKAEEDEEKKQRKMSKTFYFINSLMH